MTIETLLQTVLDRGAYKAAVIDVSSITLDRAFRQLCEVNVCGNYGKCWMCPPDVGDIDEMMAEVSAYDKALVYQTVGMLEDSFDIEGMGEAARKHNALALSIADAVKADPFPKQLQLGAGGCHLCEVCAKRTDQPCRHPEDAMPSLETFGINVSELAKVSGMKYINGPDTVTYFGALLFNTHGE